MQKIIWTMWIQGIESAPFLVRKCLNSWEEKNPGWEFRCLDRYSVMRYAAGLSDFCLDDRSVTSASLSDIVRIALLHEYGGVWVDATVFCNQPLDEWLSDCMEEGFFAFDRPDRPLASWFLAARPGNPIITAWAGAVDRYWESRSEADAYFWFHELFRTLCTERPDIAASWDRVPRRSAMPLHQVQDLGMMTPGEEAGHLIDRSLPMLKLTYRYAQDQAPQDCVLHRLIGQPEEKDRQEAPPPQEHPFTAAASDFASIKVETENLGDHVQIIAGQHLLSRSGLKPTFYVDRDRGLADPPEAPGRVPILMNGWFKQGEAGWPPHPQFDPIFLGFHIRLFQSPALVSQDSLAYYRTHGPVGCRDDYTDELLDGLGVKTFISHCLSLTLPRRTVREDQSRIFVVSRDDRLAERMPAELGPFTSLLHYTNDRDFPRNMEKAAELLSRYRNEAKLIVTSLLHCALPAIAMGIPVVMFYPINSPAGRQSDMERFSSLSRIIPIWDMDRMEEVDWSPPVPEVGHIKLALIDHLSQALKGRDLDRCRALGPIAPSAILPPG